MNACSTPAPADIPAADAEQADKTAEYAALHVMIDWSGSCIHAALEEAWTTVKNELPGIIEAKRIGALSIASFDEDGWSPRPLAEISLPVFNLPKGEKQHSTEWDSFRNIRDAVRDAEEGERLKATTAAQRQYRKNLRDALAPLESLTALPDPARQSRRTDILGLFKRISLTQSQHPQFVIVLTDLADTQYRDLPPIPAPENDVHALVLVVPAQRQDALLTTGKPLSGPEQFDLRSRQIRESAAWITVAPYFTKNLPKLLSNTNRGENQ